MDDEPSDCLKSDPTWIPDMGTTNHPTDEEDDMAANETDYTGTGGQPSLQEERKYIVFWSSLYKLLALCCC